MTMFYRRFALKFGVISIFLFGIFLIYHHEEVNLFLKSGDNDIDDHLHLPDNVADTNSVSYSEKKSILFWHGGLEGIPEGAEIFSRLRCPVQACSVSYNRQNLPNASAVVFMCPELSSSMPKRPATQQRWIFWCHESPFLTPDVLSLFKNTFNWTMTYRLDSDIYLSYGEDVSKQTKRKPRTREGLLTLAKSKKKLVAWYVSNCKTNSKREDYVKELQKYIPVDIYGRCGSKPPSPWGSIGDKSMAMLNETYLFYLAFENTFCPDYATEKVYKVFPYDVVPVVRGGANYSKFIPQKWYINTADFQSPKELANHLLHLQQHPEEYVTYLDHRGDFNYNFTLWRENQALCNLCRKLNDPREGVRTYPDMDAVWNRGQCKAPNDIPS